MTGLPKRDWLPLAVIANLPTFKSASELGLDISALMIRSVIGANDVVPSSTIPNHSSFFIAGLIGFFVLLFVLLLWASKD